MAWERELKRKGEGLINFLPLNGVGAYLREGAYIRGFIVVKLCTSVSDPPQCCGNLIDSLKGLGYFDRIYETFLLWLCYIKFPQFLRQE